MPLDFGKPLRIERLSHQFQNKKELFKDLHLEIKKNQSLAVVGPNGSGKTTFLRILSTLLQPSGGNIYLGSESLVTNPKQFIPHLGVALSGDNRFFQYLNGRDNLLYFAAMRNLSESRVKKILQSWEQIPVFQASLDTPIELCSSGMKQTLNLCRAFLSDPAIVILDEPTRSLDEKTSKLVMDQIISEAKGRFLVFSTHDQSNISNLSASLLDLGRRNERARKGKKIA